MGLPGSRERLFFLGFRCALYVSLLALAVHLVPSPRAQREEAFEWFDTLGYPSLEGKPFVRVSTGDWGPDDEGNKRPYYESGFLLEDEGERFAILTTSLEKRAFKRTGKGVPPHKAVDFIRLDLSREAGPLERQLFGGGQDTFNSDPISRRAQIFVLARACAANNRHDLSDRILDTFSRMKPRGRNRERTSPLIPETILTQFSPEMEYGMIWQITRDFGVPSITRRDLRNRLKAWLRRFPDSEYASSAGEMLAILERMADEDDALGRASGKPADLIRRLCDQNGIQYGQPGAPDIFNDPAGEHSPAHQLLRMGYAAVPPLIEAITDDRFTRTVGFWRNTAFESHYILRVGDCAVEIIEAIAHRGFESSGGVWGSMYPEPRSSRHPPVKPEPSPRQVQEEIRRWWTAFQQKGERQSLSDGVRALDRNSAWQAKGLLARYPLEAALLLQETLPRVKDPVLRQRFLQVAAELPESGFSSIFLKESKEADSPRRRFAAIRTLHKRGIPGMTQRAIELWNETSFGNEIDVDLCRFLYSTGDPPALDTILRGFKDRPIGNRIDIVGSLASMKPTAEFYRWHEWDVPPDLAEPPLPPESISLLERFLVECLDDRQVWKGESLSVRAFVRGRHKEHEYEDPRVCDLAAFDLHIRWPERYPFSWQGTLEERNRDLEVMKSSWRARGGR